MSQEIFNSASNSSVLTLSLGQSAAANLETFSAISSSGNNSYSSIFAFLAVFSALLVITARNPVISILWLISVFVNSSVYLMFGGVSFVAISYIIVYVGAIAILFLFIVMMININLADLTDTDQEFYQNLPLAFIISATVLYFVFTTFSASKTAALAPNAFFNSLYLNSNYDYSNLSGIDYVSVTEPVNFFRVVDFTQIATLGHNLYTDNAILLILTSFILLLSMISPIVLSSTYRNK